jgi:hypothetical protein
MILVSDKLSQVLVEHRHYPKVTQDIFEGLSFHQSYNIIAIHQSIVPDWKWATFNMRFWESPRVVLIAGNADSDVRSSGASYEFRRWSVLLD